MSKTKVKLKDNWTTDDEYKKYYQTDSDIAECLRLLELDEASALLDVGCGNGELALQAVSAYPNLTIYGSDGLESAIAEAQKRAAAINRPETAFKVAWADDLPVPDACADRALFRNVLHHIAEPVAVFEEIARCLKKGGLLVLQAPMNRWEPPFSEFISELHWIDDESHRRSYYTPETVRQDLEGCGFRVKESSLHTYEFPFLNQPMKDFVVARGFEERVKLIQVADDRWSITLYWGRMVAVKEA